MKLPVLSIRIIFGIIITMMGVLALILALLSGAINQKLALDNQKIMIREMISISVKERIKDLNTVSKDLGLALQSTEDFQQALKESNTKSLNSQLNNQFHQYFVTAGVIKLEQIVLWDKSFAFIQEASEGSVFFKKQNSCQNIIDRASTRKGARRMKVINGMCLSNDKAINVVIVPVGGLRLKGYVMIVTDPLHNLKAVETDLGMPLLLQLKNNKEAFISDKWPKNEKTALISDFNLKTTSGQYLLSVLTARDISQLSQSLQDSRLKVLFITGIVTLLIIMISVLIARRTMLSPLNKLTHKLRNFDSSSWGEQENIKIDGVKEIQELCDGFNYMATAQYKAQQSDQYKSQFLANMSHEIRTPLAAIIGFSETLYKNGKTEEWKTFLSRILSNGRHLNQLINDILDLSKIEANQLSIEDIPVSIGTVLLELDSLLGEQARNKGLEFKVYHEFPLPESITTDPTRLKQILINLCGNAIKFTERGSVILAVSFDKENNELIFSIKDSGVGMSTEQLAGLFKPFKQADSSTTRKFGGTGLGLYISKLLAEKLGGNIEASSMPGIGSHFEVRISAKQITDKWINSESEFMSLSENDEVVIPSLQGTILLAEDNIDNQKLISLYIEDTGATVDIANNGRIAIEKGISKEYDLILMDMQMPEMDGIESIKKLREANIITPIATLTANAMKEDVLMSEKAGADYFLTKPINKIDFYAVLKNHLPESNRQSNMLAAKPKSERLKQLTDKFVSRLPDLNNKLQTLFNNKEWGGLENEVHKLKGTGGAFGFPVITETCGLLEIKLKETDYKEAKKILHTLNAINEEISSSYNLE